MKKQRTFAGIILLIAFMGLSLACATNKNISGTIPDNYFEVVDLKGSKNEIYTKANLAFVDLFNSAESIIQYSDKEAGVLKGKYVSTDIGRGKGSNLYTVYSIIEVDVKDGKYKISMKISDVIQTRDFWTGAMRVATIADDFVLTEMNLKWKELATIFNQKMVADTSW